GGQCREARPGGVGVGRLGVVDPGDAAAGGDDLDPVPAAVEGAQPGGDRLRGDPVGAGERRGGQRVGDDVARDLPTRGGGEVSEVGERGEREGVGLAAGFEGAVAQDVLDDAELAYGRGAADRADAAG